MRMDVTGGRMIAPIIPNPFRQQMEEADAAAAFEADEQRAGCIDLH